MASGIALSTQCAEAYKALDTRACSLIVLKINEEMTEVSVEKKLPPSLGDPEGEWRAFVKELPDSDCRYVVPDFSWKETPTVTKSKICMILWSPDGASIKSKMYVFHHLYYPFLSFSLSIPLY